MYAPDLWKNLQEVNQHRAVYRHPNNNCSDRLLSCKPYNTTSKTDHEM
jgi:hypothetical protein